MAKTYTKIGKNIRKFRKKKGISQDRLSKLANVSHISIIKIELGGIKNPGVNTVVKISRALGVNINKII